MVGSRNCLCILLFSVFAFSQAQNGWAEDTKTSKILITASKKDGKDTKGGVDNGKSCHIYSLACLGEDPNLSRWVAETIPEVIQPGSWSKESLKFYAPAKILVVCHTPGVHHQVRAFLENLREALSPQMQTGSVASAPLGKTQIVFPANYSSIGSPAKPVPPATPSDTSPVSQQPMHLFHIIVEGLETEGDKVKLKNFTFRYEGEGIIDSKIASLIKSYNEQAASQGQESCKPPLNTSEIIRSLQEILKMAGSTVNSANPTDSNPADESGSSSSDKKDPVP
jgi:hypothetical protein